MSQSKVFEISKHQVCEAYRQVKANRGSSGIDGQTIEQFEQNLHGNLYKLWNRLSSGSYFPPPVKRVEIAKSHLKEIRRSVRRLQNEVTLLQEKLQVLEEAKGSDE